MKGAQKCRVLAIETSCDETAVALLTLTERETGKTRCEVRVLKNLVSSQVPIHQKYGGVVPEVAARSHVAETVALVTQAMGKKGADTFDAIAVTRGPGLATALSVGMEAAKSIAYVTGKPIIGVNHLEGHIASAWLNAKNRKHWKFPLLALVVSGGHTELVLMKNFCDYQIVGQTRDDAAGECFDKSAKLLGLPYPGGPQIAKFAADGNPKAFDLPRPMLKDETLDMSFSGLKTAIRLAAQPAPHKGKEMEDFCASIQQAIVDVLVEKTMRAVKKYNVNGVLLVGGVSANLALRKQMARRIKKEFKGHAFLPSDRAYITDNAAMIAAAGYWHLRKNEKQDWKKLDVDPEWDLGEGRGDPPGRPYANKK